MTDVLAKFLGRELDLRGEGVPEFARRTGLNESGLYQILRGQRKYVADSTLDKIAAGLHMAPSEMAERMGRGARQNGEIAADEAEVLAVYRSMQKEKRGTWLEIGLALRDRTTANSQESPRAKSPKGRDAELNAARRNRHQKGDNKALTRANHWVTLLRSITSPTPLALSHG